jgi:hypothetical protein
MELRLVSGAMTKAKALAPALGARFPMLTSPMLRRLMVAVAALSISMFFVAEGFAMANTHAAAHSKLDTSASGVWVHG